MQTKQEKMKHTTKVVAKKVITKKVAQKAPAVKKAVVKKVVKKSPVQKNTKKDLVYAPDQQSFWVSNGQILNSLLALRDALDEMQDEVYSYHAGKAHNDFAKWVDDVLADNACAVELEKAKTPKAAKTVVAKHLKSYLV